MDRQTVYPGQIPLETDLLNTNKNAMVALGFLAQDILGINTLASGLACTPNSPADLNVLVAPGRIYSVQNMDATAYSSLAADLVHSLVKQGISLDTTTLACAAPGTVGNSVNYLIQAAFSEVDANPVALPYYNASNPAQPYSGPNNSGTAQNTTRKGTIVLTAKAGVAAATGTQTTPAADAGNVGLWVVTVAYGQTQIIAGNIAQVSGAPFIANTLTLLAPLLSPAFTGTPTAPTPATTDYSTKLATTAFVNALLLACANFAVAAGTADALTATIGTGLTTLTDGMLILVRAASANATTTPSLNLTLGTTATGAKTIVKGALAALAVGDVSGAGAVLLLQYNLSGTKWVLLNPAPPAITAATVEEGYIDGGAMTPAITGGASLAVVEDATNHLTRNVMSFQGVTADTSSFFNFRMPSNWNGGTVKAKVLWKGAAGAAAGQNVRFSLSAVAVNDAETMDQALGSAVTIDDTVNTDATKLNISPASAAMTPAGTLQAGGWVRFKLTRNYGYGGSPMTVAAEVEGIALQYGITGNVSAW